MVDFTKEEAMIPSLHGSDGSPGEPPKLVRGLTRTGRQNEALTNLVLTALRERGWASVCAADVQVEDRSGGGGSACFKVTAKNADPPAIALHCLSEAAASSPDFIGRMAAAAEVFEDGGLGPRRLAYGGDWFIEAWEGTGQPDFGSVDKFKELGKLIADVHKLPTEWFDIWREKARQRTPVLHEVPHGSHVWWFTCKTWPCGESLPSDNERQYFWCKDRPCFAPASSALNRLVTAHGDCHPGNLIETEAGMRLLDFEYTAVSSAIFDVGYVFMWAGDHPDGKQRKRAFLEQYMACTGLPTDEENIERVYLDAEFHVLATHMGKLWQAVCRNTKERMRDLESLVWKMREDPAAIKTVKEQGIHLALETAEFESARCEKDFSNFHRLLADGSADQCWYVKMETGQRWVQANLADGSYVRFTLDGQRCVGQGSFTMRRGIYVESSRQGVKGELLGDQTGFEIVASGIRYIPLAHSAAPWALPVARLELKRDMFLEHFSELSADANVDQLWYMRGPEMQDRYFQYNFASRKFVCISVRADIVFDIGKFTWEAGVYRDLASPSMKGEIKGDASKFHMEFDGTPWGFYEFIPVRWNLIDWAGSSVKEAISKAKL